MKGIKSDQLANYTSNMSNHFRYRKYKFCVYFGIKIGVNINQYGSSKYWYQIKNPGIAHHYWHARTHRASEPNPTTNPIPNYSGGSSVLHNYINWFNWVQDSVPPPDMPPRGLARQELHNSWFAINPLRIRRRHGRRPHNCKSRIVVYMVEVCTKVLYFIQNLSFGSSST